MVVGSWKCWRRGSESNRRVKVLQTSPLPLGYGALVTHSLKSINPRCCEGTQAGSFLWSGRRELNPRLRPWQGRTLPLSYSRFGARGYYNARAEGIPDRLIGRSGDRV